MVDSPRFTTNSAKPIPSAFTGPPFASSSCASSKLDARKRGALPVVETNQRPRLGGKLFKFRRRLIFFQRHPENTDARTSKTCRQIRQLCRVRENAIAHNHEIILPPGSLLFNIQSTTGLSESLPSFVGQETLPLEFSRFNEANQSMFRIECEHTDPVVHRKLGDISLEGFNNCSMPAACFFGQGFRSHLVQPQVSRYTT